MAQEPEMYRRKVLEVGHGDVKLLEGLVLPFLVERPYPEEALPVGSLVGGVIQDLLVPMGVALLGDDLGKNDVFGLWGDLAVLGPAELDIAGGHLGISVRVQGGVDQAA